MKLFKTRRKLDKEFPTNELEISQLENVLSNLNIDISIDELLKDIRPPQNQFHDERSEKIIGLQIVFERGQRQYKKNISLVLKGTYWLQFSSSGIKRDELCLPAEPIKRDFEYKRMIV